MSENQADKESIFKSMEDILADEMDAVLKAKMDARGHKQKRLHEIAYVHFVTRTMIAFDQDNDGTAMDEQTRHDMKICRETLCWVLGHADDGNIPKVVQGIVEYLAGEGIKINDMPEGMEDRIMDQAEGSVFADKLPGAQTRN